MTAIATPNAFPRGTTAGEYTASSIGSTDLASFLGIERFFPDTNLGATGTIKPLRSNRWVRCRSCRNSTGLTVPKRTLVCLGTHSITNEAGTAGTAGVDGASAFVHIGHNTGARVVPVDEWLGSAGCPSNDICWVVMQGPATVNVSQTIGDHIAVGNLVICETAAASSAGTVAGHAVTLSAALTTLTPAQHRAIFGVAMSACTSGATAVGSTVPLLVDVGA